MGTEEVWIIELMLYCMVMIIPILSIVTAVYGIEQMVVRRRVFYKLIGLLCLLIGILGGIVTVTHILPLASDQLSVIQQHARPPAPTQIAPYTGG